MILDFTGPGRISDPVEHRRINGFKHYIVSSNLCTYSLPHLSVAEIEPTYLIIYTSMQEPVPVLTLSLIEV